MSAADLSHAPGRRPGGSAATVDRPARFAWLRHRGVAGTWYALGSVSGTAAVSVCAVVSVIGVAGAAEIPAGSDAFEVQPLGVMLVLAAMLLSAAFWLRRSLPLVALGAAAVMVLLLQLDASAALLTGGSLLARWRSRWRWHAFAAACGLTAAAVVRDSLRGPDAAVMARLLDEPMPIEALVVLNVVVGVTGIALALAYGLSVGSLLRSSEAVHVADELRELSTSLSQQLDHVDRRIELSQAMHDTVAKTLTHIGLRVGSLQAAESLPGPLRGNADEIGRQVRQAMRELQEVQRAMEDDVHAAAPAPPLPERGVRDMRALIDEARGAGRRIEADVLIAGRAPLSLAVDRTAYWVLSEALVNAVKHGGPDGVRVQVHADDRDGVRMLVENAIAPAPVDPLDGGRGTEIVAGRARAVGGWVRAGAEGERYVLRAWLPWR